MARLAAIPVRPYVVAEFRAMASPCRIVAESDRLLAAGVELVHELERRWSRFRPTSEISAINRAGGALCVVSIETMLLVERAEFARLATRGAFNPLMLDQIEALGYTNGPEGCCRAAPTGCDDPIEIVGDVRGVRLPGGARFDPGGIGKGLAADLVIERMQMMGAATAQVELGGDLRLLGENWSGGEWSVDIVSAIDRREVIGRVALSEGAVATSSVLANAWEHCGVAVHHLIDPATGTAAATDLGSVTAVSSQLWWAEVVAKVALIAGSERAPELIRRYGASGLLVGADGQQRVI